MRPRIRPKNGPFWGVSTPAERKPVDASWATENAKKRPLPRSVTNRHQMRLTASVSRTHETRIHGIPWILWILRIFSGKQAIMRVCGIEDAWIFCGFSRDAWIYPWMRPYPTNKAKAKNGPLRRIRWDERPGVRISFCAHETTHPRHPGDIGDIGDISRKPLKMLGFLNVRAGDISGDIFGDGVIPGDIFGDGDSHAQDTLACARCTGRFDAPKTGHLGRIRWEERPETPENDWLAHLRARYHCVCAAPVDSMRGTPTTKSGRSVGVQTPGPPSW